MTKSKQGRVKDDAKADYNVFKNANYTIQEVRKTYEQDGQKYTDDEIKEIIKSLNFFHEIIFQLWVKSKITKPQLTITKNEESNIIYPSEYRRAS